MFSGRVRGQTSTHASMEEENIEDMDGNSESSDDQEEEMEDEQVENKTYLPGQQMEDGEELVCDESAYKMYHQASTGAPCLSFDILKDNMGNDREDFPLTCYMVSGTQAERSHTNNVIVMKLSNLQATKNKNGDDDDDDDSDEDSDSEMEGPELEAAMIKHVGVVNRIRTTQYKEKALAATWSDTGKVHIWDLSRPLQAVNDPDTMATYTRNVESPPPVFTFSGHLTEGYAIDWSIAKPGHLATGDCKNNIHLWKPRENDWHVDQRPYTAHAGSVEDIQWSPNEAEVFASCSVDKSIRIWDARAPPNKACMLTSENAHSADVNVISWSHNEPLMVSGGDDGMIKVWDLRQFQHGKPAASFKHHSAPITSVEWNFKDSTVFAASGADNQLTLWDLAVEADSGESSDKTLQDVPPQLLFIHQGQKDIKELHWHPQLPGVIISTAESGFNVFRTISV
ncbi:unnamed protein product [Owenia fusiformis]|uniref:Glutamate-rich WD repeat-containing protein 1 n=1 Tax=Owenia fusiformis TaxID=6347 RepID=A0A8J1U672_OWEFU|nr:unnamed protein product [Owenia fusiformis]